MSGTARRSGGPNRAVEQLLADGLDLGGLAGGAGRGVFLGPTDAIGQSGGDRTVGAFEVPGEARGLLDHRGFLGVAGLEIGRPGFQPGVEGGFVLAGEERGLGVEPVLQRVHPRACLAVGRPGAGALLGVPSVCRDAFWRGHLR